MKLKSFLLVTLLLISIGTIVIPTMAQINPPPQNDPVLFTQLLRNEVQIADNELFKGFTITITNEVKSALIKKIDVVIMLFEEGNFQGAYEKLDKDLATKLNICDTTRVRALSWLSVDPELSAEVYAFAGICQDLIQDIRLADPR